MKQALQFVRGAVATKDLCPILTHLHIYNGRIQGSNGRITIDCPCPDAVNIEATVPMGDFTKAIDACNGEPTITIKDVFMHISSGKFKVKLPLEDHANYPRQVPTKGIKSEITGNFLQELSLLQPFVSKDASRLWSCGVLFKNGKAFATNNSTIACLPAFSFPTDVNLPDALVNELLRIGRRLYCAEADDNNITFYYEDGAWCKATLSSLEWPDVSRMIPDEVAGISITEEMRTALSSIRPFCPDAKVPVIVTGENGFSTDDGDKSATFGGFVLPTGKYRAENLELVFQYASEADFSKYPKPIPFKGSMGMFGLMMGTH